jgi:hypothetical protein
MGWCEVKPEKLVTATLVAGLLTAPLMEAADKPHTHTENNPQLLDACSINCLAPSITGQQLYRSEEETVLRARANAALARWWANFSCGVNSNEYDNWVGSAIYGVPRISRASSGILHRTGFDFRKQGRSSFRGYKKARGSTQRGRVTRQGDCDLQ